MTRLKIEYLPIAAIQPYCNNFNDHPDHQVDEIVASIREFGFVNPIGIYGNEIVYGHGRYLAAQKMKMAKVPIVRLDHLSERQRRAYVIADNKIARNSVFNFEKLAAEVDALSQLDFDISLLGFDEQEIDALLKDAPGILPPDWDGAKVEVSGYQRSLPGQAGDDGYDTDSDGVHAPERVKDGELWQLGRHFLLCGDATDAAQVDRLLDGARPRLLITDPPYGVDYDPSWRGEMIPDKAGRALSTVENDHTASWLPVWQKAAEFCEVAYVWHGGLHAEIVRLDLEAAGFVIRAQIIWAKDGIVISRGHYHWQHEPCWYAVQKGASAKWIGDRSQTTLWNIPKPKKSETGHSTQKPIECMGRPMQNHEGDVFDPFVGSGSTIIAGEQIGRTVYAMELKPRHCDIVLDRWETFTGEKAVLCER